MTDVSPIEIGREAVDDLATRIVPYVEQHPGPTVRQLRGVLQRRAQDVGETVARLTTQGRLEDRGDTWRRLYVPTAPDERQERVQEPREPASEPFSTLTGTLSTRTAPEAGERP